MKKMLFLIGLLPFILFVPLQAQAFVKLDGYFIAFKSCEAYQSKNKQTNPGQVLTQPFHAYELLGINVMGGEYYQIKIHGAPVTNTRWLHSSCGLHVVAAGDVTPPEDPTPNPDPDPNPPTTTPPSTEESTENVLALSWQPAFCEKKSKKTECIQLNGGNLPITERQLSIHGLWPKAVYCDVSQEVKRIDSDSGRWFELPVVPMDEETRELLSVAMPGVASGLHRHEWIKHGTCYKAAGGADEYYDDTLLVTAAINNSAVGQFLADHVGAEVSTEEIRTQFDLAFGQGAGERVQFHCSGDNGRVLLQELKINLSGVISPQTPVKDLILAAEKQSLGCPRGVIDPAGLQ